MVLITFYIIYFSEEFFKKRQQQRKQQRQPQEPQQPQQVWGGHVHWLDRHHKGGQHPQRPSLPRGKRSDKNILRGNLR